MMWLRYVYSGRVEWDTEDTEKVLKLAEQYGPDDLPPLCARMRATSKREELNDTKGATPESSLDSICTKSDASNMFDATTSDEPKPPSQTNSIQPSAPKPEVIVPEELRIQLKEASTTTEAPDLTLDYEDPLQGISLDSTTEEQSLEDDCVILDGTPTRSENRGQYYCSTYQRAAEAAEKNPHSAKGH
ncbi:hypothetical protein COOONC_12409 [Cooperia oncophora]